MLIRTFGREAARLHLGHRGSLRTLEEHYDEARWSLDATAAVQGEAVSESLEGIEPLHLRA